MQQLLKRLRRPEPAGPERESMKNKQIIGLVVAAALFIVTGAASVFSHSVSDKLFEGAAETIFSDETSFTPPSQPYIGVVDIVGTIQEQSAETYYSDGQYRHTTNMEYIDKMMTDSSNAGILLNIDSPGGTVYESQELYDKLMEYKENTGRPIYGYMTHYGASGAYMIAMAADKVYANKNTITGSIGVIMSGYDLSGLYEKLGIRNIAITSGKNKANTFTKEQMDIYQSQVDEMYQEFVQIVAEGRDLSESQVRKLADGRTYTAKQAKDNGLIDGVTTYEEVQNEMRNTVAAEQFYELESGNNIWASLFSKAEGLLPKSDTQVLKETAEEFESGVFMYYADL